MTYETNNCKSCGTERPIAPELPAGFRFYTVIGQFFYPRYGASGGMSTQNLCFVIPDCVKPIPDGIDLGGVPGIVERDGGLIWAIAAVDTERKEIVGIEGMIEKMRTKLEIDGTWLTDQKK